MGLRSPFTSFTLGIKKKFANIPKFQSFNHAVLFTVSFRHFSTLIPQPALLFGLLIGPLP